jgi:hypothetical protein
MAVSCGERKKLRRKTMSNWIDYHLDVLAMSPAEISQIADPLLDHTGQRMKWVRRVAPKASR